MKLANKILLQKVTALLSLAFIFLAYAPMAVAASVTTVSDQLSRLKASTASNHTITFTTPTGISSGQTVTVTFPAGFTMGSVAFGDIDITDNGTDLAIAATPSGTTWGAAVAGQVLTLTNGTAAVTAGHTIVIEIGANATFGAAGANQITNPTAATYVISIGGTMADSGKVAVAIIAEDQIPVTGTVNPTISLTVANTTLDLATLDSGTIATSAFNNITIGTNGSKGYTITIKDANAGLLNSAASKTITSGTATLVAGTEGYGANCNKVSGSGTCTFVDGATENVTGLSATGGTFASYNAKPSGTETFQVRVKAAIATTTDAGAYVDTLTVIGTANF